MKNLVTICALLVLTFLPVMTFGVMAQEKYSATEMKMLREHGFLGGNPMPDEGLGDNPTVKELRRYYSPAWSGMEDGDRYSPAWVAVSSAVLPGAGQMICRKPGRGIVFLFCTAAPAAAAAVTYKKLYVDEGGTRKQNLVYPAALACVAAVVWVWNIVDAAEVAVLTNKYNRDMNTAGRATLSVNPYLSTQPLGVNAAEPVVGLSLAFNF